jgi:glycosyltransferase involved in cell wall biosynthesis
MKEVAGGAACLVDPNQIVEIREGILKIIQDEGFRQQLVSKGFANVRRFEPAYISEQYLKLYEQLTANGN